MKSDLVEKIGAHNVLWELHDAVQRGASLVDNPVGLYNDVEEEITDGDTTNLIAEEQIYSPFVFDNTESSPSARKELIKKSSLRTGRKY